MNNFVPIQPLSMTKSEKPVTNMVVETSLLSNGTMAGNNNCNNNHNSSENVAALVSEKEQNKEAENIAKRNEVFEETRQVVRMFLERSLSQNAKSSLTHMKPVGYHRLMKDGKLPFYQRQQSKPEQGVFERKEPNAGSSQQGLSQSFSHTRSTRIHPALPSRPSLNELTSESKKHFQHTFTSSDEAHHRSNMDVRTLQRLSETESTVEMSEDMMICKLLNSQESDINAGFQSSDSLPSTGDDGSSHHIRRKSFSKAVSRKSIISMMENKKSSKMVPGSSGEPRPQSAMGRRGSMQEPRISSSQEISHSHRLTKRNSSLVEERSLNHSLPKSEITMMMNKEETRHDVEKKTSFRDRMKRLMTSTSTRRKIKHKKSEYMKHTVEERSSLEETNKSPVQHSVTSPDVKTSTSTEVDFARHESNTLQNATGTYHSGYDSTRRESAKLQTLHQERSPSPRNKSSFTPKLLRSLSQKSKNSPKNKRRPFHQSGSSTSLSNSLQSGGQLERNKSGSLPLSMRYGIDLQMSNKARRFSEDFSPSTRHSRDKNSLKRESPNSSPVRPHHLDLETKKAKTGKLKQRILRLFRKRHVSESSTGSSRSQSLPSIPAATEQVKEYDDVDGDISRSSPSHFQDLPTEEDEERLASTVEHKPYQHRGSLSFSSGDLDNLSLPEKKKIYDEIAESLSRISSTFNRHIHSRSSTPGSRLTTPESSFSTSDYRLYAKGSKSGPPSRQTSTTSSKGLVHPTNKSFRKYKDENQPALAAYFNIRNQSKYSESRLDKMARMPKHLSHSRHIRHAQTGSLDSPHSDIRLAKKIPAADLLTKTTPGSPSSSRGFSSTEPADDVVDGLPSLNDDQSPQIDEPQATFHFHGSHVHHTTTSGVTIDHVTSPQNPDSLDGIFLEDAKDNSGNLNIASVPRDSRPSTSKEDGLNDEDEAGNSSEVPIDEDKLVNLLVEALCKRGDEYNRSIDLPNGVPMEPVFRNSMISYMRNVSYSHFHHFAQRFCHDVKQLVQTSPTRHPEIFPVVMAFNMTELMIDLARSDTTWRAVHHILNLSTQFVTEIVTTSGQSWRNMLDQLRDTEEELTEVESPDQSPRRNDEEVD